MLFDDFVVECFNVLKMSGGRNCVNMTCEFTSAVSINISDFFINIILNSVYMCESMYECVSVANDNNHNINNNNTMTTYRAP